MNITDPTTLSRLLAIAILAIGSLTMTGCISSQVTDPVEIDRQVAFAESDSPVRPRDCRTIGLTSIRSWCTPT